MNRNELNKKIQNLEQTIQKIESENKEDKKRWKFEILIAILGLLSSGFAAWTAYSANQILSNSLKLQKNESAMKATFAFFEYVEKHNGNFGCLKLSTKYNITPYNLHLFTKQETNINDITKEDLVAINFCLKSDVVSSDTKKEIFYGESEEILYDKKKKIISGEGKKLIGIHTFNLLSRLERIFILAEEKLIDRNLVLKQTKQMLKSSCLAPYLKIIEKDNSQKFWTSTIKEINEIFPVEKKDEFTKIKNFCQQ